MFLGHIDMYICVSAGDCSGRQRTGADGPCGISHAERDELFPI